MTLLVHIRGSKHAFGPGAWAKTGRRPCGEIKKKRLRVILGSFGLETFAFAIPSPARRETIEAVGIERRLSPRQRPAEAVSSADFEALG